MIAFHEVSTFCIAVMATAIQQPTSMIWSLTLILPSCAAALSGVTLLTKMPERSSWGDSPIYPAIVIPRPWESLISWVEKCSTSGKSVSSPSYNDLGCMTTEPPVAYTAYCCILQYISCTACTAHTVLHILYCIHCTAYSALHILHYVYCILQYSIEFSDVSVQLKLFNRLKTLWFKPKEKCWLRCPIKCC